MARLCRNIFMAFIKHEELGRIMYYSTISSPYGDILLTATNKGLSALSFVESTAKPIDISNMKNDNAPFIDVKEQLNGYFSGQRQTFDLSFDLQGTPFQQLVWQRLLSIKFGTTQSYGWLAEKIDKPKAVRAVGGANGKNPVALIIPCHRVIGSNGTLTGYAGGLTLKEKLLRFEGAINEQK